ncbi:MAG: FecR family protein [Bacteroidales bacterium]
MKLNINNSAHTEIIAKYITGEMNEEETAQFNKVLNKHPENRTIVNKMKNDWNLIGSSKVHAPSTDKAWCTLFNKLERDNLIPQQAKAIPIYKTQWGKWAATVALIVAVGSIVSLLAIWGQPTVVQSGQDSSTLVHTLADGSTVYLKANTKLKYSKRFSRTDRSVSLSGEAFFDIESNPKKPFVVNTNKATIAVLGTSFTVKSNTNDFLDVLVETGTVSVSLKNRTETLVAKANERITLSEGKLAKTTVSNSLQDKWRTNRLQFKDETIESIIQVINKTYGTNIILGSQGIAQRRLTVTFQNNSINSMVEIISATLNLNTNYSENSIILTDPMHEE